MFSLFGILPLFLIYLHGFLIFCASCVRHSSSVSMASESPSFSQQMLTDLHKSIPFTLLSSSPSKIVQSRSNVSFMIPLPLCCPLPCVRILLLSTTDLRCGNLPLVNTGYTESLILGYTFPPIFLSFAIRVKIEHGVHTVIHFYDFFVGDEPVHSTLLVEPSSSSLRPPSVTPFL